MLLILISSVPWRSLEEESALVEFIDGAVMFEKVPFFPRLHKYSQHPITYKQLITGQSRAQ